MSGVLFGLEMSPMYRVECSFPSGPTKTLILKFPNSVGRKESDSIDRGLISSICMVIQLRRYCVTLSKTVFAERIL